MKITKIGIAIIVIAILVFGFIIVNNVQFNNNSSNETVTMQTISKGGVTINYPSNWVYSQATSNDSVIAISKQNQIDGLEVGQVNINVERREFTGDFANFVNKSYNNLQADPAYNMVSSGEVDFNGETALQYIYTSNSTGGVIREHKAIWVERGNNAYVILYSAPIDRFDGNLAAADYIISHIIIN